MAMTRKEAVKEFNEVFGDIFGLDYVDSMKKIASLQSGKDLNKWEKVVRLDHQFHDLYNEVDPF